MTLVTLNRSSVVSHALNKIITKKSYSLSVNLKSANAGASTFVFSYLSEDVSICIGNVYSVHGGLS